MSRNQCCAQAWPPCVSPEEQGDWVWVPKSTYTTMPGLPPAPYQCPMYRSFSAGSSQASAPAMHWSASPVIPACSPVSNNIPSFLDESPIESLHEGLDIDMALQLDTFLGDLEQPWLAQVPDNTASTNQLFNTCTDAYLFSDLDFNLAAEAGTILTPPSTTSPASSMYGTGGFPDDSSPILGPLTPASLSTASASPESASPTAPDSAPTQSLPCSEPSCTKVFSNRHDLRKHERRKHRQPFRCRLCDKGHVDKRALDRHLWAKHPEYAQQSNARSERVKCPHCEYEGRGDNVARHMKRHAK